MDDFWLLHLLSLAMFIGSYVAGLLPIILPFSETKLRLVAITGAGLLVGTALAVIIPEGVNSIYRARAESNHHIENSLFSLLPLDKKLLKDDLNKAPMIDVKNLERVEKNIDNELPKQNKNVHETKNVLLTPIDKLLPMNGEKEMEEQHEKLDTIKSETTYQHKEKHLHDKINVHSDVGLALVAGFVLMLLVDQLAQSRFSTTVNVESGVIIQQARYKITATIGLVVHAAADGIALGAASGSSYDDVQFIVFVAIMLHKAPAAFGLVTFLLHEGLDRSRIKKHLLIFSLAAPLAAVFTFFFITKTGSESLTSLHATGVLLLFSAGTFLYVATVHVLPEVTSTTGHLHHHGTPVPTNNPPPSGLKLNELIALVVGAVLPTVLTVGHSH